MVVFGGGWSAVGTQQSIEAQVIALQNALRDRRPTVLFAGGPAGARSVQIQGVVDDVSVLLALVFNQGVPETDYRPSKVKAAGAASRQELLAALMATDDPAGAIVFGIGHGAPAEEDLPAVLELWGPDDRVSPDDLAQVLRSGRQGPTAFVLGQCHSGAFTRLMYQHAQPRGGLARPARCVFAAVPGDREASGCTADLTDPGARAYISTVTEALSDAGADYDRDGHVRLVEAHAYAKIHDRTIDVPVSSTEMWLAETLGTKAPDGRMADLEALLAAAAPHEAAVLKALGGPYLSESDGAAQAHRDLSRLRGAAETLRNDLDAIDERYRNTRQAIFDRLVAEWPELQNPIHPVTRALLAGPAPVVVKWLRAQEDLPTLLDLDRMLVDLDGRLLAIMRRAARLERFTRAVQRLANEQAWRHRGGDPTGFDRLTACEALSP